MSSYAATVAILQRPPHNKKFTLIQFVDGNSKDAPSFMQLIQLIQELIQFIDPSPTSIFCADLKNETADITTNRFIEFLRVIRYTGDL